MRTNVLIDDALMESALKVSGLKTKKDVIEEGLRLLVQIKSQEKIKDFRVKLKWNGVGEPILWEELKKEPEI
jgi:Arc/MetJ family transcription regulator